MTCHAHPWGLPDGLPCLRTDEHTAGHVYAASDAPDGRHDDVTGDEQ